MKAMSVLCCAVLRVAMVVVADCATGHFLYNLTAASPRNGPSSGNNYEQ
jgi:hypothetical protein